MPAGPRVEAQPCSNQSPPFTPQPGPQSDPAALPWCITDRRGQGASRPELGRDTPGGCPRDTVPRAHSGGLPCAQCPTTRTHVLGVPLGTGPHALDPSPACGL